MFLRRKPRESKQLKQCAQCGREFLVPVKRITDSKSGLVFCSTTCSGVYQSAQKSVPNAQCRYCGKAFHRSPANFRSTDTYAYCLRECYDKARKEGIADKRKPIHAKEEALICHNCGKAFVRRHSVKNYFRRKFCSDACERQSRITTGSYVPREFLKARNSRCEICGLNEPAILEVHHKDRNRRNNADKNLILICPNCHRKIHRGTNKQ